jgi:dTDP-4-amino-4,6-dideoxygalactose transaminase
MARTRASILLACQNMPYLVGTRAIPSVLRQSVDDWELIAVSAVRDNTAMRETVDQFRDARIRYEELATAEHEIPPAQPHAAALNRAQQLASGDVLFVIDEETEFLPSHLEECLRAHQGGADVVHGRVRQLDLNTGVETAVEDVAIHPCGASYRSAWRDITFTENLAEKWTALRQAGATFVGLDTDQAVTLGGADSRVRVSMPSLPPTGRLHALVDEIATTRQLSNSGPLNAKLESALAEYLDVPHVITAASGDTALGMAMLLVADRRGDKDEVVLPSYTFPSTVNAVIRAGLTPVFCDVEPDTLCASAATMAPLVSDRTLALFPVHAHGMPCDVSGIAALAHDAGALLVTDSAAALGAEIGTQKVGSCADIEVFSLSSTKVLTSGEGGFLSLRDDRAAARLREIARYGLDGNFVCVGLGVNGRLTEMAAGMALAGMDYMDGWLAARRRTATRYEQNLQDVPQLRVIQHRNSDRISSAKDVACVVESPELRDQLAERLARYRIETRPYFRPLHKMAPFKDLARSELEVTEQLIDTMLCLPITSEIPEATVDFICGVLKEELADILRG